MKKTYALIVTLAGIVAGIILLQKPVDIPSKAVEPSACGRIRARCIVNVYPASFHPFKIEVEENGVIMQNVGTYVVNPQAGTAVVEFISSSSKNYVCKVIPVTLGGAVLDVTKGNTTCAAEQTNTFTPICFGLLPSPTQILPTRMPTKIIVSPSIPQLINITPTPTLFPGCPASIEPILCVTRSDGTCIQ